MDIHALKRQGFTISEIARRTHHDRKTIRAYLHVERVCQAQLYGNNRKFLTAQWDGIRHA